MKTLLTASRLTPLLHLFYVLLVDQIQSGDKKPDPDTALEINALAPQSIKTWDTALPALRNTLLAVLKGKGKEGALAQLGAEIKQLATAAKNDQQIPSEDLELFNAFGMYFRTKSQVAMNKLQKFASASDSPWVVQHLAPKASDQASTRIQLETLVKQLVGRKDSTLTLDESKQIKELKPEEYKAYLILRKAFNQSWKDALVAFIRKSGEQKVPYKDAINYLKLNGIDHLMATGFDGLIDDRARLYTKQGKLIEGSPNATTFPTIVMNKEYGKPDGGDWVFRADRVDGTRGPQFYTSDYKRTKSQQKFAKVADLSKKMEGMRKKWFAVVKNFKVTNQQSIEAVILELLFEFSARIGSAGNAAGGQSTYGIATLLVKHAIIDPSGNITLKYKGKDGVATVHKLFANDPNQKFLVNALHELLINKEPTDRIFTVPTGASTGRQKAVMPGDVNRYFKSLGAGDTTVHKIRTYAGTKLFNELMAKFEASGKKPKNEKEALAIFKKMAEAVGTKLNHVRRGASGTKVTGNTAIAAYIDVTAQIKFFRDLGFRIPKYLEKFDTEHTT